MPGPSTPNELIKEILLAFARLFEEHGLVTEPGDFVGTFRCKKCRIAFDFTALGRGHDATGKTYFDHLAALLREDAEEL